MPASLVGTWILRSYISVHPDGSSDLPYGEAIGRLSYDAAGNMAGQVMRPGRAPVARGEEGTYNLRAAYMGYVAYFGTYELDDRAGTVVHHVQGSLNPTWVGSRQVRRMRVEGDRLILEAQIDRPGGMVRHVLTWERLAPGTAC